MRRWSGNSRRPFASLDDVLSPDHHDVVIVWGTERTRSAPTFTRRPLGQASTAPEYSHSARGRSAAGGSHGCRRVSASHNSGCRDSKLGNARLSPGGRPGSGDHARVVGANLRQLAGVESRQRWAARRCRRAGSLSWGRRPPGWLSLVQPNPSRHEQVMVWALGRPGRATGLGCCGIGLGQRVKARPASPLDQGRAQGEAAADTSSGPRPPLRSTGIERRRADE